MLRWLMMIITVATPYMLGAEEADQFQAETQLYPEAPEFTVAPRNYKKKFRHDCTRCHEAEDADPEPRRLKTRHIREIDHGGNRFWCLTCHDGENMDFLRTSRNEKIKFDQSYLICGSCHANRQKDWYFGAHGKRVSGWQGDRVILPCTQCHNPHSPATEARKPKPVPPVRIGLERQQTHIPAITQSWKP
ncbi:MAG: cytochrome C [Gammaproteobacteria bacterium]|nr:cytochrome C [Gammaproteobacteria bacterium]MDX2487039.1 cytochrome C [Gammaproteobacteria bacterium]